MRLGRYFRNAAKPLLVELPRLGAASCPATTAPRAALRGAEARARRQSQPFSLLIMDLQGFKAVNDRLGHAAGDQALIQVAQARRQIRRESYGLYRLGGDEFALLLPQTSAENALVAAQRYAQAIRAISIQGLPLGVNIGLAAFPRDSTNKDILLRLADERMYEAKAQGISILPTSAFRAIRALLSHQTVNLSFFTVRHKYASKMAIPSSVQG